MVMKYNNTFIDINIFKFGILFIRPILILEQKNDANINVEVLEYV